MVLNWFKNKPPVAGDVVPTLDPNPAPSDAELLAQSLVKQLSAEILQALSPAQAQVQQLRQLSPTLTQRMQPVFEAVERAHDIAKSAQLFSDAPNLGPAPETLDAANIVRAAIMGRSDWLQARHVQVRQALTHAQVQARPGPASCTPSSTSCCCGPATSRTTWPSSWTRPPSTTSRAPACA